MNAIQKFFLTFAFIILICFAVGHIFLSSLTFDETSYIASGYSYLKTGKILLNLEHPTLSKLLAGFPDIFLNLKFDKNYSRSEDHIWFQNYFFLNNSDKFFSISVLSRLPVFFVNLLCGIVLFAFCRECGFKKKTSALLSLILTGSPSFIGLSALVINDVLLTLFFWSSVLTFYKIMNGSNFYFWIMFVFSLSFCLLTKFSGLIVLPALATLVLIEYKKLSIRLIIKLFLSMICVVFIINIFYFNLFAGFADYWSGFKLTGKYWIPDYKYFLNGKFYDGGNYFYFIFSFLYKTSELVLILVALSLVCFFRIIIKNQAFDENRQGIKFFSIYCLIPALFYFVVLIAKAPNIGYRFVLPLLFISIVFCGFFLNAIISYKWTFYIMIFLVVFRASVVFPDYISFFNEFSGGSKNGINLLDDSNVDWGQDLNKINHWMKANKIGKVNLLYFGTVSPALYGVNYDDFKNCFDESGNLKAGCYVISAHFIRRLPDFKYDNRKFGFSFENSFDKIGDSLYAFKLGY